MTDDARSHTAAEVVACLRDASYDEVETVAARYLDDPRATVRKAAQAALRRHGRERDERQRVLGLYASQHELGGTGVVLGVDEVGRGAVAGPLTVAAVVLPPTPIVWGLDDSKRLTPRRREQVAATIREVATAVGLAHVDAASIDRMGMSWALRRAMARAIERAGVNPDTVLIDGVPVHVHERERCVVKGDATIACIAAASIVAKVTRDALMTSLDERYPGYHLAECKGYASAAHIAAIRRQGISAIHRRSFCDGFLEGATLL